MNVWVRIPVSVLGARSCLFSLTSSKNMMKHNVQTSSYSTSRKRQRCSHPWVHQCKTSPSRVRQARSHSVPEKCWRVVGSGAALQEWEHAAGLRDPALMPFDRAKRDRWRNDGWMSPLPCIKRWLLKHVSFQDLQALTSLEVGLCAANANPRSKS